MDTKNQTIYVDSLTVVIPCKNEKYHITDLLYSLYYQNNINNLDVIIADSSDDNVTKELISQYILHFSDKLNITIIEGGFPAQARLNGSKLCNTDYLLFIDADVMLVNQNTLSDCVKHMSSKNKHLLTLPFKTNDNYTYVYDVFNVFQNLSVLLNTPFAVGGFQLWKTSEYWKLNGYNPDLLFAEDYHLSSKVNKKYFTVFDKHFALTDSRRFKNKGLLFMFKMMILSYINRNNIDFFKQSHNYWS